MSDYPYTKNILIGAKFHGWDRAIFRGWYGVKTAIHRAIFRGYLTVSYRAIFRGFIKLTISPMAILCFRIAETLIQKSGAA